MRRFAKWLVIGTCPWSIFADSCEKKCRDGIPGADWFLDHVHPSIQGHQQVSNALAEAMVDQGYVLPAEDWSAERTRRYKAHVEALDDFYFVKGQQRLDTVRQWARGGVQ